jgi:hypothetical protein
MAARCPRRLGLVLLLTSLLTLRPPSLAAQSVRYEYDALGWLTVVSMPAGPAFGASGVPIYCYLSLKPRANLPSWISPRAISGLGLSVGMAGSTGRASGAASVEGSRI